MKTKLLLGLLFAVSMVAARIAPAQAAGFAYDIVTTISIGADAATQVETQVRATADGDSSFPSTFTIPVYGANPDSVRALDGEGNSIPTSTDEGSITLRLNSIQANSPDTFSVNVLYNSTSGVSLGVSTIFMLSPFNYGENTIASEEVTILSSGELGSFVTRGLMPADSNTTGGSFTNVWKNNTGAIQSSFGLLFGDQALAELTFTKTLQNDTFWWQTQTVVLPPDTNQQQVFVNEITPSPRSVHLDVDGNIILEYRLRPRQALNVEAKLQVALNSYTYALDSTLLANDIDQALVERYTTLNDAWADSSLTFENAATTPVAELLEQIYDSIAKEYASLQGENTYEVAIGRSNRLVGELRANGIPARLVVGAVFGDGGRVFIQPQAHAWVEAYVPDVGWVTLDPNFEQNGDYFGVADVQRVALALRGFDPDFPPENSQNFAITFSDSNPPAVPVMKPTLTGTKHMIFPGLTVNTVDIEMPQGVIVDNAGLAIGSSDPRLLGSLAPFQKVNVRSSSILAAAFTSESLQYGTFANGTFADSDILAQGTMDVSYLPMALLLAIAAVGYLVNRFVLKRWRGKRARKKEGKPKKETRSKLTMSSDAVGDEIENVDMLAALDLPDDDESPAEEKPDESPQPEEKQEDGLAANTPPLTDLRPPEAREPEPTQQAESEPAESTKEPMRLERAHEASPAEIRKEIARKRPAKRNLIQ